MLEILTAIALVLAIGCMGAALYYIKLSLDLCTKLAISCVHMKVLLQVLINDMANKGYIAVEQATADEKAKMN